MQPTQARGRITETVKGQLCALDVFRLPPTDEGPWREGATSASEYVAAKYVTIERFEIANLLRDSVHKVRRDAEKLKLAIRVVYKDLCSFSLPIIE